MHIHLRPDRGGACADPGAIRAAVALFGLHSPTPEQVRDLRDSAAALFAAPIATADSFLAVESQSGASLFGCVSDGRASGYLAFIRLRREGRRRLEVGTFDPIHIDPDLVAPPGERPAAFYAWGFAAVDRRSAYRVVSALDQIQRSLYWAVPKFCSTASAKGEQLAMGRLGYRKPGPSDRFAFIPAFEAPPLARDV